MQKVQIWNFLDEQQREEITNECERIVRKIQLPVPCTDILRSVTGSKIVQKEKNDLREKALTEILIEKNKQALMILFREISEALFDSIFRTIDQYEEQTSIKYLKTKYLMLVNGCCKSSDFEWRIKAPKERCLWLRLHEEVRRLLKSTLSYMKKRYEFSEYFDAEQLSHAMNRFQKKFETIQKRLNNLFNLNESVTDSLISLGETEREGIEEKDTEMSRLISALEKMQMDKEEEEKLQQKQQAKQQKGESFFNKIKTSGKRLIKGLNDYVEKGSQPAKTLEDCQKYSNNLDNNFELTYDEENYVLGLTMNKKEELFYDLSEKFSKEEKDSIVYAINYPIMHWQESESVIQGKGRLVEQNSKKIFHWKEVLDSVMNSLECGEDGRKEKFFVLLALFYSFLEDEYCPLAKRYLVKMSEAIENIFPKHCPYLRGALKILERKSVRGSQLARKLQETKPVRSNDFSQTEKSRISRETYFQKQQTKEQKIVHNDNIRFERLTYAKPCKNVVFVVSGFLSEDTEKDLEWEGVIRALEDNEMYGVIWKSSTAKDLAKYLLTIAGTALIGAKGAGILGVLQMGYSMASQFIGGKQEKHKNNPFWESLTRATEAGHQLADQLIEHFSDRFVTLIGFSMGTEVVRACIQRLIEKKKDSLLYKIATFGGVADKNRVEKMLDTSNEPLNWINFKSRRDYAVRYLYRVCTMGAQSIGAAGVKVIPGHEVENWELEELVNGHMDFRSHLRGLCLMAGMRHD